MFEMCIDKSIDQNDPKTISRNIRIVNIRTSIFDNKINHFADYFFK